MKYNKIKGSIMYSNGINEDFIYAVNNKDTKTVEGLLRCGANARLLNIIHSQYKNIMGSQYEFLEEEELNINTKDSLGRTALMIAVINEDTKMVELLLKRGATIKQNNSHNEYNYPEMEELDINATDNNGKTVLMYAVTIGCKDIVESLLDNGADIEARDNLGETALMYAVKCDRKYIVESLLNNGADIEAQDIYGKTALTYAYERGHIDIIKLLDNGAKIKAQDNFGKTVFNYTNNKEIHTLLEKKYKKNFKAPTCNELLPNQPKSLEIQTYNQPLPNQPKSLKTENLKLKCTNSELRSISNNMRENLEQMEVTNEKMQPCIIIVNQNKIQIMPVIQINNTSQRSNRRRCNSCCL